MKKDPAKPARTAEGAARATRLKAALKANLQRRKAQAKARGTVAAQTRNQTDADKTEG